MSREVNIDCLAGPTHHFGGLAYGNIASIKSKMELSRPKEAALQGLEKMKLLYDLGIPQIVLPPHPKPDYTMLQHLGFSGSEQMSIENAYKHAPELLLMCSSSSAMWTANSATVTPSTDSENTKVHITPANLAANFHRSLEVPYTSKLFKHIFSTESYFCHHEALPAATEFFDEGAANHTRFCKQNTPGSLGLHLFVYGRGNDNKGALPKKYPARQTLAAQQAVARLHQIPSEQVVFAQQHPNAIDAGVFHNDVISTGHEDLFFYHEESFVDTQAVIDALQKKAMMLFGTPLQLIEVTTKELPLEETVKSYLFNSQIVSTPQGVVLIAPHECQHLVPPSIFAKFDHVHFVELNQSMKNGGGPACLRLRMVLSEQELQSVFSGVVFSETLYHKLKQWLTIEYPESFYLTDLLDPQFRKKITEINIQILKILDIMYTTN